MAFLALLFAVGVYAASIEGRIINPSKVEVQASGKPDSASRSFRKAAVTSDTNICAPFAADIMENHGGSAVDGIITDVLCSCMVTGLHCGIGGGHFAMVYERPRDSEVKELMTVTARERAPAAATEDMFVGNSGSSTFGGLAVGVPGEICGFHEAWKRYGRVPWKKLFEPSIRICEKGFKVERDLAKALIEFEPYIRNSSSLGELYVNKDGSLKKQGDLIVNKKLGKTMRRISEDPETFYSGSLADDIVADIKEFGGVITKKDLISYKKEAAHFTFKPPIKFSLKNGGYDLYSVPPPASGAVVEMILNVLDGYGMTKDDVSTEEKRALTYHRIVEAYKFAYAKRSALGDDRYVDVTALVSNMTSSRYGDEIRAKISDDVTQEVSFYDPLFELKQDQGTAHYNVLGPDGGAVAMTSTINTGFGSKVRGPRTGILFNNQMDDFSTPGTANDWGVPASPSNFIKAGKMPMSSISPIIALQGGERPVFLVGTAGGTRITTTNAFLTANTLWFGTELKETLDLPRFHHQLLPNYVEHESWMDKEILELLEKRGHKTYEPSYYYAVSASIRDHCAAPESTHEDTESCVQAVQDGRRGGTPSGF